MSAGAQAWAKGLEDLGQDARRSDCGAGSGRTGAQGPPLRRARMAREPDLRHHPPDLFADLRPAARHGRRDRRRRRRDAREIALRDAQLRRCDEPVQLRADQPAGAQADARDARRESAQGPRQHAQGHCGGAADADQAGRVRGRPEPGDDAGQGDQADAALPADPVHADDRRGAEDAGRDLPAVDQPLLHPRPQPEKSFVKWCVDKGITPVHGQLEVGRREHRRRDARRLCAEGPGRRDRRGARPARRRERARDRLLRRRDDAGRDARLPPGARARRTRSSRRPSSPPRSISPKRATSSCSPAPRRWGCSTS